MAMSAGKKPSKFSFAKSIKDTVKPVGKADAPAEEIGQGSVEEKTVPATQSTTQEVKAEVKTEEVANDTNVEASKAEEIQNSAAAAQEAAPVAKEETASEVQADSATVREEPTETAQAAEPHVDEPKKESRAVRKNKGGRKSMGEVKKMNIAIPVELLDGVTSAATLLHKGNVNSYIRTLIIKDLKENKETYDKLNELKKMAGF